MMFVVCSSTVYTVFVVFSIMWMLLFFVGLAYSKDIKATLFGVAIFHIAFLGALYFLLKIFNGGCIV